MRADIRKPAVWTLMVGMGLGVLLAAGCHRSTGSIYTTTPGGASGGRSVSPNVLGPGPGAVATEPGTGEPAPLEPNPQITPGATLPVTKDDICVPGYSQKVRNVPADVKRQAYANYNIANHRAGDYEVDHLISLELGGSNSIKNLWPQSYRTQPWNAHVKDKLENALHDDVCSDRVDLRTAQQEIASDWIGAYKREFHTSVPLSVASGGGGRRRRRHEAAYITPGNQNDAPATTSAAPGSGGQVWVNLRSGKYFYPGMEYYGKTKRGEYLSEADAQRQGYVAAKGQGAPVQ